MQYMPEDSVSGLTKKDLKKIVKNDIGHNLGHGYDNVHRVMSPQGIIYFVKNLDHKHAIGSVASAKMYREIGIPAAPVRMFKDRSLHNNLLTTIQPDVTQTLDVKTILARDDLEFAKIPQSFLTRNKWQILYDPVLREKFLKIMTPACLDKLIDIFLVDEVRTDSDRTVKNYFFYKSPNSDRYEGVIVIDQDYMQLFHYYDPFVTSFAGFSVMPYRSMTPQQNEDLGTYRERIMDIRELLDEGLLSRSNIKTLTDAILFNFPKEVSLLCQQEKIPRRERRVIESLVSGLWDYAHNTIGKDLGL